MHVAITISALVCILMHVCCCCCRALRKTCRSPSCSPPVQRPAEVLALVWDWTAPDRLLCMALPHPASLLLRRVHKFGCAAIIWLGLFLLDGTGQCVRAPDTLDVRITAIHDIWCCRAVILDVLSCFLLLLIHGEKDQLLTVLLQWSCHKRVSRRACITKHAVSCVYLVFEINQSVF